MQHRCRVLFASLYIYITLQHFIYVYLYIFTHLHKHNTKWYRRVPVGALYGYQLEHRWLPIYTLLYVYFYQTPKSVGMVASKAFRPVSIQSPNSHRAVLVF